MNKKTYLKKAWMISWKAIANGIVSLIPIVKGDGPREPSPTPTPAVLNSKLPTLSARAIVAGLILPRICSERREGGRGMAILLPPDVGVGI